MTKPPIPTEYDRLELLYEVQNVLAQRIGVEQACDALLSIVTRSLRVRTAVVLDRVQPTALLWTAAGLATAAVDEAREHALRALEYLAPGNAASTKVVGRTAAVLSGGVAQANVVSRHFVTLPLIVRGDVFGVFQLEGAVAFEERDLLFINAVANQLAVVLDRNHVQAELAASRSKLERANRRLSDLQAVTRAALEGATLDESLAAILRAMHAMFEMDAAAVLLATGSKLRCRSSIGLEDAGDLERSVEAAAADKILATGTALFFDDLEGVNPSPRAIRSLLGAPMRARDRVTGVVYVASRKRRAFAHDELQLLELVAERIETIIDNANLYEQALAAIRSRDVVMGAVAHDLRNPLSAIQMSTELLATQDPKLVRPMAIIRSSTAVMIRLIDDLRDVASIEAGHFAIRIRSEDARELVRVAAEGIQAAASNKPVRIETSLPTQALVLACDRVRIIQVLTNMLSNAVKFTPKDGSITISIAEVAGVARFSVADTGCGIPAADLPHVFDPYWQAKKTAHLGTGLGLAIARGIVEAHGGTISVESQVDHGTTFSFTLPLSPSPEAPLASGARAVIAPHQQRRVLVVDDAPNVLAALVVLLEKHGFVVETAGDGIEALSKVRELAPDILIADVEMPQLDGPGLVRKLREDLPDLPVILMTGHGEHVAGPELGASYISKPLEIDDLVSMIHHLLDK